MERTREKQMKKEETSKLPDEKTETLPMDNGKPGKKKRQFFLVVPVIAFALLTIGQMLGQLLGSLCIKAMPGLSDGVRFLFLYLSFIGIDLMVILYCALCEKSVCRSFRGYRRVGMSGNTGKRFAQGLLLGFLMNGACILVAWLHGDLHFSIGRFELLYLLFALAAVCIQSGAEELVTRGYMMGALRERYPAWVAIAMNSLFFSVIHLGNRGITPLALLNIALIGFALSLIICYFDSLWMCIAIHTAWNFTQNFLFGLPNSGVVSQSSFLHLEAARSSPFYDAVFGVESTITSIIVISLVALGVWLLGRKKQD